jgi:hypothetical protein
MPLPTTYTTAEVAESLKASVWWIKKQVKLGRVTPIRMSDAPNAEMRFTEEHVDQLVRALTPEPVATERRRRKRRAA